MFSDLSILVFLSLIHFINLLFVTYSGCLSLSFSLSVYHSLSLSLSLSLFCVCLSLHVCVSLSLSLSHTICLCVCVCVCVWCVLLSLFFFSIKVKRCSQIRSLLLQAKNEASIIAQSLLFVTKLKLKLYKVYL